MSSDLEREVEELYQSFDKSKLNQLLRLMKRIESPSARTLCFASALCASAGQKELAKEYASRAKLLPQNKLDSWMRGWLQAFSPSSTPSPKPARKPTLKPIGTDAGG